MIFLLKLIVAGYILSVYNQLQEEQKVQTPGNTPVKRRHNSQSQVTADNSVKSISSFYDYVISNFILFEPEAPVCEKLHINFDLYIYHSCKEILFYLQRNVPPNKDIYLSI